MNIARRCNHHRLVVLPKRWTVERTSGRAAISSGIAGPQPPSSA
jgi:hypothetical protein